MLIHDVTAEEAPFEHAVVDLHAAIRIQEGRLWSVVWPFVLIVQCGATRMVGVVATEHVEEDVVGGDSSSEKDLAVEGRVVVRDVDDHEIRGPRQ